MNTLRDSVDHWARLQPHAPFLIAPESRHSISYGEFEVQTRQLAGLLAGLGIPRGAHIGLYLQNGIQTSRLFYRPWLLATWLPPLICLPTRISWSGCCTIVIARSYFMAQTKEKCWPKYCQSFIGSCVVSRSIQMPFTWDSPNILSRKLTWSRPVHRIRCS